MSDADFYLKGPIENAVRRVKEVEITILTLRKDVQRLQAKVERLEKGGENAAYQELAKHCRKSDATLDAVRFAVMLAGQSIVEAHGEDSAAYEAIQSVAKALEEAGDE